ncbi:MAG: SLBB domain-containing protein [Bacteroidales bacterium]|nr:SLBB domain-containing protein [Bacteroidales bacterium]
MARSYGYSDAEIDNLINHRGVGGSTGNAGRTETTTERAADQPTALVVAPTYEPATEAIITPAEKPVADKPVEKVVASYHASIFDNDGEIFGHSYFVSKSLGVIPTYNAPAPASYILGPGDEVVIDIWGATVSNVVTTIEVDGSIIMQDLGPVYISGMNLSSAQTYLKEQLSRIYSGLHDGGDTFLRLSINKIKGVSVSVSGEVEVPGVYTIPSLSSISSALFMAGGVRGNASVRNISVYRHGAKVAVFDLYELIFDGKLNENLRLQDGDVIYVPSYTSVISVRGSVVQPMKYEIRDGETVKDVLKFAQGFTSYARKDAVNVSRRGPFGGSSVDVAKEQFGSYKLQDGDVVSVNVYSAPNINRVTIQGPVRFPGAYAIGGSINDVASLVKAAGGLIEGAFTGRGQINRLDDELKPSFVTFNLEDIMNGKVVVNLKREDVVNLFASKDFLEMFNVSIEGHVNNPGSFTYKEGMTVLDLILMAKGVREDVFLERGHIRRLSHEGYRELVTFNLKDVLDANVSIPLMRNDEVHVYSRAEFLESAFTVVDGQVNNPGKMVYHKGMTLKDAIIMAGGFTNGADLRNVEVARRGGRERGTVDTYDFENDPETADNVIITPYDIISVRKLTYYNSQTTVIVEGEVISPGHYTIAKSEIRLSDVMRRAGGFTEEAYPHGARLTRVLTEEEKERQAVAVMIASKNMKKDSLAVDTLADRFFIGIDLEKAMANPGSMEDILLRDGDIIEVPTMNNTVKVSGGVFYPNTVTFDPSMPWKDYIRRAGGFTKLARRGKTYAVYMNGDVSVGGKIKPEPGMELVVPERKESEDRRLSPAEIASLATSATSVATLVTTLIRLF